MAIGWLRAYGLAPKWLALAKNGSGLGV